MAIPFFLSLLAVVKADPFFWALYGAIAANAVIGLCAIRVSANAIARTRRWREYTAESRLEPPTVGTFEYVLDHGDGGSTPTGEVMAGCETAAQAHRLATERSMREGKTYGARRVV